MDIESFIQLKNEPICLEITESIKKLISMNDNQKKHQTNKQLNILKNPKLQSLKDKTENKVNLILNKLSELNMNILIVDFYDTLGKIDETIYNDILKTFYIKIQTDINFVKIYLTFLKVISKIYNETFGFQNKFFYDIIESKINYDYFDIKPKNDFSFLIDYDNESKRINNILIIKTMIELNMFNNEIIKEIDNIILSQSKYYTDIYYWFQNTIISDEYKNKIKSIITNNALPFREKVLLDNLLENKTDNLVNNNSINETINQETLEIEIENILEEYLMVESILEVITFINTTCKDAITKNKFCQYVFEKYFTTSIDNKDKLLNLLKNLIKKQSLYKSNLSKGLLVIYSNWSDKSIDFFQPKIRMTEILQFLKQNGITNNLESIFKHYKIDINNH